MRPVPTFLHEGVLCKRCSKCRKPCPLDGGFHRTKDASDGLVSACKACTAEGARLTRARHPDTSAAASRNWAKAHPEAGRAKTKRYTMAHPEKVKAMSDRWRAANPDKVQAMKRRNRLRHPETTAAWSREWRQANPERSSAITRKYRMANPEKRAAFAAARRARERGAFSDFTEAEWETIKANYGGCCAYCGVSGKMSRDHVIPLGPDGPHTASNIVPACRPCNTRKGNRSMERFYGELIRRQHRAVTG